MIFSVGVLFLVVIICLGEIKVYQIFGDGSCLGFNLLLGEMV